MQPDELKYAKSHEWVALENDIATIGITDFAVELLTDLVYIELPPVGSAVKTGEPFGVVESVKAVSDLYSPIAGEVIEVNEPLIDDQAVLSEDPFGEGWMIKIKLTEPSPLDHLLDQAAYKAFCATEDH